MALNNRQLLGSALFVAVFVVAAWAARAGGASIRLHDQAGCDGPQVLLADVAELSGAQAEALGKVVVARFDARADYVNVTMDSLRRLLSQRDLNPATMSLCGYARCRVVRLRPLSAPAESEHGAPLVANSIDEIDLKSPVTLRDLFVQWFTGYASIPRDELQFRFTPGDVKVLRISAERQRFEFTASSSSLLGKVTITIGHYRDDRLVDTYHIRPFVTRRLPAVVVTQKVKRGQTFTSSNMRFKEITLDRNAGIPVRVLDDAVGMVARSALSPDTVLLEHHMRRPYLVRQGELVTVRCISGGLVIRTVMRATADGSLGDVIKVRNERAQRLARRQRDGAADTSLLVRVTGLRQTQTVDAPSEAHAPQPGSERSQISLATKGKS